MLVIFISSTGRLRAQQPETEQKPARILFLVDASGSMNNKWQNEETRFHAASRIIKAVIDSIYSVNRDVTFGLRVFGSQYPAKDKNCYDSKLEVPFGYANKNQIALRLKYIRPEGFSPIAWSLAQAAKNDLTESNKFSYSIILITDGGESCGGDICKTYQTLLAKKISFKPYILSLLDYKPLQKEYDCLGKYLVIANEEAIEPTIKKIINDNRKILTIKMPGLHQPVSNVPPPLVLPQPVILKPIIKAIPIQKEPLKLPQQKTITETNPVIKPIKINLKKIDAYERPFKMNLLYTIAKAEQIPTAEIPPIKIVMETPPTKVAILPETKPKPNDSAPVKKQRPIINHPDKLVYSAMTEKAPKTTLLVYFTDGKGKFYPTEPEMILKLSNSNQVGKTVYRNMDGNKPAPINISAGTYDIIIPGSDSKALNVPIIDHKTNIIYIKAGNGSLEFYYPSDPKTPIKEYTALVSKTFIGGAVVKQNCAEVLSYEPANYHIEINTLPPLMYNINLDFFSEKLVAIPKPGTMQITNTERIGKIQFWYQLGDRYVPFFDMFVSGNTEKQKAKFLPGRYQVRYYKLPIKPYQKSEVVPFRIMSDKTTSIYLQP